MGYWKSQMIFLLLLQRYFVIPGFIKRSYKMEIFKGRRLRNQYKKQLKSAATKQIRHEVFRLARNRDILGIILVLENIVLIILFLIFILPLIK